MYIYKMCVYIMEVAIFIINFCFFNQLFLYICKHNHIYMSKNEYLKNIPIMYICLTFSVAA